MEDLTSGLTRLDAIKLLVGVHKISQSDGWRLGDMAQCRS